MMRTRRTRKPLWDSELTVLGVFVIVVAFGFTYGLANLLWPDFFARLSGVSSQITAAPQAPSAEDYQSEARAVLKPFLTQVESLTEVSLENPSATTQALATMAQKTQDRLVRVRVPKEFRERHLAFVLLLEQWKRALAGSAPDRVAVIEHTRSLVADNPWLMQ